MVITTQMMIFGALGLAALATAVYMFYAKDQGK